MLENHWNTLKICLFGQTTKQPLCNFEPWKPWKYKQLWGLVPEPSTLQKRAIIHQEECEKVDRNRARNLKLKISIVFLQGC